jgi:hypothetical protein
MHKYVQRDIREAQKVIPPDGLCSLFETSSSATIGLYGARARVKDLDIHGFHAICAHLTEYIYIGRAAIATNGCLSPIFWVVVVTSWRIATAALTVLACGRSPLPEKKKIETDLSGEQLLPSESNTMLVQKNETSWCIS